MLEAQAGRFVRIDLDDDRVLVLERERALAAHPRILKLHRVPAAMSADLQLEFGPEELAGFEEHGERDRSGKQQQERQSEEEGGLTSH